MDGVSYFNGMEFLKPDRGVYTFKQWTTPEEFYRDYLGSKELKFIHHKIRYYGEPKMTKPKELKGIKEICTVDFIPKKCKCKVYVLGNDVWIHHKDYFSESMPLSDDEFGMPLGALAEKHCIKKSVKGFIYPDGWGDIVLRNEAYIVIKNLVHRIKLGEDVWVLANDICRQQEKLMNIDEYDLNSDMERFWSNVVDEIYKFTKK